MKRNQSDNVVRALNFDPDNSEMMGLNFSIEEEEIQEPYRLESNTYSFAPQHSKVHKSILAVDHQKKSFMDSFSTLDQATKSYVINIFRDAMQEKRIAHYSIEEF